jgi:hypothetical protein
MALHDLTSYFKLDDLAHQDGKKFPRRRYLFQDLLQDEGKHFAGITGPRGAGKTVLLKQLRNETDKGIYISLDTLQDDLFELVHILNRDYEIHTFFLDEIHAAPDSHGQLKKIYDFLNVRIVFTSSVALAMHDSSYDLSRRVLLYHLDNFSLAEYVYFKYDKELPLLTLEHIIEGENLTPYMSASVYFNEYLQGANLPFALQEPRYISLLKAVLDKIIQHDIPMVQTLKTDELPVIRDMVTFIGRSGIDGINYSTLAHNLNITKYKARQYVELLEKAFVVKQVFPGGTNVMKEPKVLFTLPYRLLFKDYHDALGPLREDFFVSAMTMAGYDLMYLKSTRGSKTPDYMLKGNKSYIFEIGGPGKGRSQFKGIHADRKIIFSHSTRLEKNIRPLFLLGFLSGHS